MSADWNGRAAGVDPRAGRPEGWPGEAPEGLFRQPGLLSGNLAKVKIVAELLALLESRPGPLEILDVGCAGPTPFNQWRYLLAEQPERIRLTGIDVRGLERARAAARELGFSVELREISAYRMADELARTFDVVVSTQVLEHLRRPDVFLEQLARTLRPDGVAYLSLDSAHFRGSRTLADRARDLVRPWLGERYHDSGLTVEEVQARIQAAGLHLEDLRLYNLGPLKRFHNHELAGERQGRFLRDWYALEETLNGDPAFLARHRRHFADIYLKARRAR